MSSANGGHFVSPRYVKYSLANALCYVIIICRVRMCVYTITDEPMIKFTMVMRTINVRYP